MQRTSGNGSDWLLDRCGCLTASQFDAVMSKLKNGSYGAGRATYMGQVIAERLTGVPTDGFQSSAMLWGIETEPLAIAAYEAYQFVTVEPAAFIRHPCIEWSGASPDGLVGDDGLVEAKCCNTSTHIERLLGAPVPRKYLLQTHWQMACTGRQWADLVYFDPRMPSNLQLHVERIQRDDGLIAEMESEAVVFLAEVASKVEALRKVAA